MRDIKGLTHAGLIASSSLRTRPGLRGRLWRKTYALASDAWGADVIATKIHKHEAVINFAHPYQIFERAHTNYNAPQVEAVLLAAEFKGGRVHVIDVGASVGDTALLLIDKCSEELERLDCVDGDPQFFELLSSNLQSTMAVPHLLMLSDETGLAPELIRTQHQGTASAVGARQVPSVRLDQHFSCADVVKIDVDGYDGTVLGGASALLETHPVVLFEWHPILCEHVGTDWRRSFTELESAGYDRFILFTKFGDFSQVFFGIDWKRLTQLRDLCLESRTLVDWHFDVMALAGHDDVINSVAGLERWSGRH